MLAVRSRSGDSGSHDVGSGGDVADCPGSRGNLHCRRRGVGISLHPVATPESRQRLRRLLPMSRESGGADSFPELASE
jgi:hypothetical protein